MAFERDVTFATTDPGAHDAIDAAYHAKYDRYGPKLVGSVVGAVAHDVTLRLVPAGERDGHRDEVIVVIGAGSIGQAIARRVSTGKHVVLADLRRANAEAAAEVFRDAGFDVTTAIVDVTERESVRALAQTAAALGDVTGMIHAAGVVAESGTAGDHPLR